MKFGKPPFTTTGQRAKVNSGNQSYMNLRIPFLIAAAVASLSPAPAQARQCGEASWYGPGLYGNRTSNGEVFRPGTNTAAHPYLPFGSWVKVVNQYNGRVATVRINDRGPFVGGRIIDIAHGAAGGLGLRDSGVARVCVYRL